MLDMINELWKILEDMGGEPEDWGEPHFEHHQGYYEPMPLSSSNFDDISTEGVDCKICCVDGGNNLVYQSPIDSIHLIRVYFNIFEGPQRVDNIDPMTAYLTARVEDERLECRLHPLNDSIPVPDTSFTLDREELSEKRTASAGRVIRTYLEWHAMHHAVIEYLESGDTLVKDGVLQTSVERERVYAEDLYGAVEKKDIDLVGVAKTCSLRTSNGYPLVAAVRSLARDIDHKRWFYHPLAENKNPDHKGDMCIAKYHPQSDHVFRTEFYREKDIDKKKVLRGLAEQSKDPAFLGYPYGLVDADIRARVTDEEVKHLKRAGLERMKESMRHRVNALNAHEVLSDL